MESCFKELDLLCRMIRAFSYTLDMENICHIILKNIVNILKADSGSIFFLNQNQELEMFVSTTELMIKKPSAYRDESTDNAACRTGFKMDEGIAGWVGAHKEPLKLDNAPEDKRYLFLGNRIKDMRHKSILCLPLINKKEMLIGVINLSKKKTGFFKDEHLKMLEPVMLQFTDAIENIQRYQGIQSRAKQITVGTLRSLTIAIEEKDMYTRGHSERVARYAVTLARAAARRYGFRRADLENIEVGSLLHDIGKIGVPENILNKKDPLKEDEWALIRQHPGKGARIVEPVQFLKVVEIIRQHHERLDGSGYPFGLKGEDILPEAKILAIADSYDAMTSNRSYRKRFTKEKAAGILLESAGTLYDADLVRLFVDRLEVGS